MSFTAFDELSAFADFYPLFWAGTMDGLSGKRMLGGSMKIQDEAAEQAGGATDGGRTVGLPGEGPPLMAVMLRGATAGLLATVPMTAVMVALHRSLPLGQQYPLPPRQITERLSEATHLTRLPVLDEEEKRRAATLILHFGYGAAVGALYGPLAERLPRAPLPYGIGFGLLVWAGSYLGWLPALGILRPATAHPARRNAVMIAAHVVFGAALGVLADRMTQRARRQTDLNRV